MMEKGKNVKTHNTVKIVLCLLIACIVVCTVVLIATRLNKSGIISTLAGEEQTSKQLVIETKPKNTANFTNVTSTDGIEVPVPTGYRASDVDAERSVNGGFVIYEGLDPVPTDATGLMQAQINRNQWVWVPISSTEFTNMYHNDGNKIYGNWYEFSNSGTAPTLYKKAKYEPSLAGRYDRDTSYLTLYLNEKQRNKFKDEMEIGFYNMLQSVKAYGGFYISRYEVSDLNQNVPSTKRLHSNINNQNWYKMYEKCKELKGNAQAVETHMIWGIQFDETLKFLINTGAKTYQQVAKDSTTWGNFKNATFTYYNSGTGTSTATKSSGRSMSISYLRSGTTDYAKANNIYDLAGNVWDWTMESYLGEKRFCRGGGYDNDGSVWAAGFHESYQFTLISGRPQSRGQSGSVCLVVRPNNGKLRLLKATTLSCGITTNRCVLSNWRVLSRLGQCDFSFNHKGEELLASEIWLKHIAQKGNEVATKIARLSGKIAE